MSNSVEVKRRLPVIPRERNGGVCTALAGNLPGEVIHITSVSMVFDVIEALGAIAGIVSLALQLHDRYRNQKKK